MNDKESSLVAAQVLQMLCHHVDLLLEKQPDLTTKIVKVQSPRTRRMILARDSLFTTQQ